MSHLQSLVLARSGHLRAARTMSRRAVELAEQADQGERAAVYQAAASVWEALFGDVSVAVRNATQALELSKGRDVEYGAALALALSRDLPRSQALADDLEKRFPEVTSVRFSYLPVLRALVALDRNETSRAIELLQVAAPGELAIPGSSLFAFFGALYPVYVRGEAYRSEHQGREAAAEFQKILDHPGIVFSDPMGVLARLQLGRAYVLAGDYGNAKSAYQDFFMLWRDADPDIPILQQARAEYAKFQ